MVSRWFRRMHFFTMLLFLTFSPEIFCLQIDSQPERKERSEDRSRTDNVPPFGARYQQNTLDAIELGRLEAIRDEAYAQQRRETNLQAKVEDARRAAQQQVFMEQAVRQEELKDSNKTTAFQHAKLAGALAAATTIGHDQYMAQEKTMGSSVWMGVHNGITRASSALINAALVAGVTYVAERVYQHFAGEPEQKTLPPAIVNALVRKKQQEMLSKEKTILNADVKALKEQSAILASQCANANTPEQKKLCEIMREAILKQNLMHLAKRSQLDHAATQKEEDEDDSEVVQPTTEQAKKPEQKNDAQPAPTTQANAV